MASDSDARPVLIVGNERSISKCRLKDSSDCSWELVSSLEEAAEKHSTGEYARVVLDPEVLRSHGFEILSSNHRDEAELASAEPVNTSAKPSKETAHPIVHLDRDLRIIWLNEAFKQEIGADGQQLVGRSFCDHYADPDLSGILRTVISSGRACRIQSRNGSSHKWVVSPLISREGRVYGLTVVRSDSAFQNNHYSFHNASIQTIIDNVPMAIALVDGRNIRMKCANLAYQKLVSEHSGGDYANIPLQNYCPHFVESGFSELVATVATSGVPYVEPDIQCHDPERGLTYWHVSLIPIITAEGLVDVLIIVVDVNEQVKSRKHVEELMEQTEESLAKIKAVINSMSEGLLISDLKGNLLEWNAEAIRIFTSISGLEPKRRFTEFSQQLELRDLQGKEVPVSEWPITRACGGETFSGVELLAQAKNHNDSRILSFGGTLVRNNNGDPILAMLTIRDVTEQKAAMREAQEGRLILEALMEHVPEGITIADASGQAIKMVSKYGRSLLDKPNATPQEIFTDALMNDHAIFFSRGEQKKELSQLPSLRAAITGEVIVNEEWTVHKHSGDELHLLVNAGPIKDSEGNTTGSIATWRDIRVIKETQSKLEEARAQAEQRAAEMESFLSSIADGIVIYNADGEAVFVNDAMREILGMPVNEKFSDWTRRCQRLTFEGKAVKREDLPSRRALKGDTVQDMRYKLSNPWGRQIVVSCSASPVFDRNGKVIGATNVFRDISERVDIENEKQRLYEREHRIAEILQQALIPPQESYTKGHCTIALKYCPALNEAEVGGDFYDVFDLNEGKVGLLIGDIAGKGLAAAMRVASVRYAIRSYAYLNPSPSAVMSLTNEALCREDDHCSDLLTAYFAVADVNSGLVTYSNAGHEPPVIWGAGSDVFELDGTAGCPLGIEKGTLYTENTIKLEDSQMIVALTDGITEARTGNTLFGKEGVYEFFNGFESDLPEDVAAGLLEAARSHAGGSLQDDAAILVMKWNTKTNDLPQL